MRLGLFTPLMMRALLLLLATAAPGCAWFKTSPGELFNKTFKLPAIELPPDSIQLDVVYVERPLGDARLGDELWRYADEISVVETDQRAMMRENGFRVGVVGSNPPQALQCMLGLKSDFAYEPHAEKSKQLIGHRYVLRSGGHQTILASPVYPACTLDIPQGNETVHHSFENAQCKYRVTASTLQDGWVQLEFVPQLHHGDDRLRIGIGESGDWEQVAGQRTESLFPQKCTVRLSVGEMAVLTASDDAKGRLGELFFRGPAALSALGEDRGAGEPLRADQPLAPIQRVLVVRLAGMSPPSLAPQAKK